VKVSRSEIHLSLKAIHYFQEEPIIFLGLEMGGCTGSTFNSVYTSYPQVGFHCSDYEALLLCEYEIGCFFKTFLHFGSSGGNAIPFDKLCTHLKIESNVFSKKVIGIDVNASTINFHEFVMGIWNFCTIDKNSFGTISHLCFFIANANLQNFLCSIFMILPKRPLWIVVWLTSLSKTSMAAPLRTILLRKGYQNCSRVML
jgi:hypothetical protein